jgi:hypothetical protein
VGGGDESQGLDALITIVPPPEVCVETVNWHLRGAEIQKQVSAQPENQALKELSERFPPVKK